MEIKEEVAKFKAKLIQLLTDASEQVGDSYEDRAVLINDFEGVSKDCVKLLNDLLLTSFYDAGIAQKDFMVGDTDNVPNAREYVKDALEQ